MDFKEYAEFAAKATPAYFATMDGDKPRVRPIGVWFADETGIYFFTQTMKSFYKQLEAHPKVELCFMHENKVMRVSGEVERIDDISLKERLMEERPSQKDVGIDKQAVYRLYKGEAFFWTMKDSRNEASIERCKFNCT
jgi:pyridoxamine 5'-phosphate oxidase